MQTCRRDTAAFQLSIGTSPSVAASHACHSCETATIVPDTWRATLPRPASLRRNRFMSVAQLQSVLLWCTAINYGLLMAWVLIATWARTPWQRIQIRVFNVSAE